MIHIGKNGPEKCPAKKQCRLKDSNGNPAPHFDSMEEAQQHIDTEGAKNAFSDFNTAETDVNKSNIQKILKKKYGEIDDFFGNKDIAKAVARSLGKSTTWARISTDDLEEVEIVTILGEEIENLEGIEQLKNLKSLNITSNKITDLSPIAELTKLETLEITNNNVSDLSPLKNLNNIKYLRMNNNQILDISVLANLSKLCTLQANNNNIEDLSSLESLKKLDEIHLNNNNISTLVFPNPKFGIEILELNNNNLSDLTSFANCPDIKTLSLSGNKIKDITSLTNKYIYRLDLSDNEIKNISSLNNIENLEKLDVSGNEKLRNFPKFTIQSLKEIKHKNTKLNNRKVEKLLDRNNYGWYDEFTKFHKKK